MTIDKLQGQRIKVATIDEWLSGDVREDVVGAIEQSSAKEQGTAQNNDYLILAISSEGTVRNGSGDTIKMELMKILKGEYSSIHTSIWWYKLDSIDEVSNPEMWIKANPNLGKQSHMTLIRMMLNVPRKIPLFETIFWRSDLVFQWKAILIISLMKKHYLIRKKRLLGYAVFPRSRSIAGR